jgi:hypothetical protein
MDASWPMQSAVSKSRCEAVDAAWPMQSAASRSRCEAMDASWLMQSAVSRSRWEAVDAARPMQSAASWSRTRGGRIHGARISPTPGRGEASLAVATRASAVWEQRWRK